MGAGVLEYAIKLIRDHLATFLDLISQSEGDEVCQHIKNNVRENQQAEMSMVVDDCWTGAIWRLKHSGKETEEFCELGN